MRALSLTDQRAGFAALRTAGRGELAGMARHDPIVVNAGGAESPGNGTGLIFAAAVPDQATNCPASPRSVLAPGMPAREPVIPQRIHDLRRTGGREQISRCP